MKMARVLSLKMYPFAFSFHSTENGMNIRTKGTVMMKIITAKKEGSREIGKRELTLS